MFLDADTVNAALAGSIARFATLDLPVSALVNSHPKSGTHLLRNILLHFFSARTHAPFLFHDNFATAAAAAGPRLFVGHVPWSVAAAPDAPPLRKILLVRHPATMVLALARAFYDGNTTREDFIALRSSRTFEEIVACVLAGYAHQGQPCAAPVAESLRYFTLDWLEGADCVIRFEDIRTALAGSDDDVVRVFEPLFGTLGCPLPDDAAARIRAGSAGAISTTYSRHGRASFDDVTAEDVVRMAGELGQDGFFAAMRTLGYPAGA